MSAAIPFATFGHGEKDGEALEPGAGSLDFRLGHSAYRISSAVGLEAGAVGVHNITKGRP